MDRSAAIFAIAFLLSIPGVANSQVAPDAAAVEWEGKKVCEVLFEDTQIRVLRCEIPPGGVHVRHSHPARVTYTLNDGRGSTTDAEGTREYTDHAGTFSTAVAPAVDWHEVTNIGSSPLKYVLIDLKYKLQN
jgi:quercetin dioxygenase-like cupin family protein